MRSLAVGLLAVASAVSREIITEAPSLTADTACPGQLYYYPELPLVSPTEDLAEIKVDN
jgi:hypothetical protein